MHKRKRLVERLQTEQDDFKTLVGTWDIDELVFYRKSALFKFEFFDFILQAENVLALPDELVQAMLKTGLRISDVVLRQWVMDDYADSVTMIDVRIIQDVIQSAFNE